MTAAADTDLALPEQCEVLTSAQAFQAFSRAFVRVQLAGRRWQSPCRGIVVLHNGPLTDAQRAWVAVLGHAPGSVLGGLTALEQDGLEGFDEPDPHVVMPEGSRRLTLDGVRQHWSRELTSADVHPLRTPPRTRPQRSLVDAASWCPFGQERRARAIVVAGVQQRLARTRDLRDALQRRGPCRHRALIVESILDAHGGIQSLPERDFDQVVRDHGLPKPTRQSPRQRSDGRYYLDVEWRGLGAACEIHGIPHLAVKQWESDLERANEITISGPRLLVFSSYAVRRQQSRVGDQIARMLRRGGWRG